jgi:hypothetical protein
VSFSRIKAAAAFMTGFVTVPTITHLQSVSERNEAWKKSGPARHKRTEAHIVQADQNAKRNSKTNKSRPSSSKRFWNG